MNQPWNSIICYSISYEYRNLCTNMCTDSKPQIRNVNKILLISILDSVLSGEKTMKQQWLWKKLN